VHPNPPAPAHPAGPSCGFPQVGGSCSSALRAQFILWPAGRSLAVFGQASPVLFLSVPAATRPAKATAFFFQALRGATPREARSHGNWHTYCMLQNVQVFLSGTKIDVLHQYVRGLISRARRRASQFPLIANST